MNNGSPLLKISDLSVTYRIADTKVHALNGVSLEIPSKGYTLGIVGESGSGKTTLGMSILNVVEPPGKIESGLVEYNGQNVLNMRENDLRNYRWGQVSMVYQSAMNSLNPVKKISDPIVEVILLHSRIGRREATERALNLIKEVGLNPKRAEDFPFELSGGMRQRVIIALALALSPNILIADEPTSALDVVVQKQILRLLKRQVSEKGLSLIFITHEIALLSGLVENVAVMYAGKIVEMGPINQVLFEPLHPYTEMLLNTLITIKTDEQPTSLPSASPATTHDATAQVPIHQAESDANTEPAVTNRCPYAGQCKYAFDRCWSEAPNLTRAATGRLVSCHKYN